MASSKAAHRCASRSSSDSAALGAGSTRAGPGKCLPRLHRPLGTGLARGFKDACHRAARNSSAIPCAIGQAAPGATATRPQRPACDPTSSAACARSRTQRSRTRSAPPPCGAVLPAIPHAATPSASATAGLPGPASPACAVAHPVAADGAPRCAIPWCAPSPGTCA